MNQIHPYQKTSNLSTINLQYKRFSLLGIIWLFFLVSIQAACPNTEMLDLGFTGNGTATMKVVEVEDASHYQIVYRKKGTTPWNFMPAKNNVFLALLLLEPDTKYEYKLRVKCGSWKPWTDIKDFSVPTNNGLMACTYPAPTVTNVSEESVFLTWPTVPDANNYQMIYRDQAVGGAWTWKGTTATNLTLDGLTPDVTYEYMIRSRYAGTNDWLPWNFSDIKTFEVGTPSFCGVLRHDEGLIPDGEQKFSDRFGNVYSESYLESLSIGRPSTKIGHFNVIIGTDDLTENEEAVINRVFLDICTIIQQRTNDTNTDPSCQIPNQDVNILVTAFEPNDINAPSPFTNYSSNVLGIASPLYSNPVDPDCQDVILSRPYIKINGGIPFPNQPGINDGLLNINPNETYYTELQDPVSELSVDQFDLYQVVLHEALHLLGFASRIGLNDSYSLWDQQLFYTNSQGFINPFATTLTDNVLASNNTENCWDHTSENWQNIVETSCSNSQQMVINGIAGVGPIVGGDNGSFGNRLSHLSHNCNSDEAQYIMKPVIDEPNENGMYSPIRVISDLEMGILCEMGYLIDSPNIQCDECFTINNSENGPFEFINLISLVDMDCCKSCFYTCISQPLTVLKTDLLCNDIPGGESIELIDVWTDLNIEIIFDPNNPDEIVIIGAEGFIEEGEIFYTILGCEGDMHSASFFVTIDYCPPCENEPCDNLLCEDDFEVPSNLQIFGDPAEGDIWRMSWFGHPFITEQQASAVGNRNTPLIDKFNGDDFLRIGGFNRSTVAFKLTEPINNCSIEFTFDGSASIPNGVLEIRGSEFPPCHRCTEIPIGDNCDQVTDCGDYEFSPACIGQVDIDIDEPVVCDVILEDLILEPQSLIVDVNADFDINYIQLSAQNGCLYIDNIRLTKYIYPDFEFEIDCSMADFNSLDECLANSHIWDFGDPASGANNTSTLQNPIHTYEMNGTYVVTHTIIDECNTSTSSQEIVIDCEPLNCDETPDGYISLINESTSNSLLFPGSQSTGVDYFVEGVLTINKSYTFLNCNFLMGEGAEIIIDPGFVLNSENCVYEACDKMWNGIDLFNQSVLNSNGDIFMDANRAIEGIYKFPLVSLNGSNFRGNYVGVYDGPNAATTFTQFVDVEMYGTRLDGSIAEPYDGMIGVDGINTVPENLSRGRNGVWISHNNSAIIGNPDLPSNYFENLDHAFEFHRSTVTLLHNSINSCSTGIFAEHSDLTANGISVNQALIENCNLGISTIRSDIEIINYHITDCPQSIRVEQSPNEISINDNLIERSTNNIEVSLSDLAQMQINQNQIIAPFNVGQPAFGIRIIEQNDRVENNNMHTSIISDNTISADYGISSFSAINLVNADNHLIVSNCIIDPRWTAMDIFNSNSNIVSCNSISGIGNGMRISQSINGRYKCNIVDLSGSAVRFFGTCTGTDFAGNNLTGYTALSISGITGHQIHKGNTFETIGIHEVANFASSFVLLQASTFFYDDNLNSEFLPDSHWFPNLPTAALDDWFKFDPDLSNETYYCQTPIVDCTNAPCLDQALISPDVITSIDLGNANGSIRFEDIYVGENRNLEDALYLKLDRLPELVFEDQLIEGFYNTTSTSSIGAFRELEKSVSNSLMLSPENKSKLATYRLNKKQAIDDLQIILDNLPADPNPAQWNLIRTEVATANGLIEKWAGYEQELKDVTNIIRNEALGEALIENNNISEEHSLDNFEKVVVDAYISIKMSADNEYILDTGVSNELAYIANQCPSIYGKVVHKARGLMYLINPEMMFDDDVLCQQPYNFQSSNPDNEKNALEFNNRYSVQNNKLENVKLQPNPTNSKLEITGNLEQCIFYLFDIHGKLLINENVNSDMHSIDVSSLSPGIYHCKLINESGETVFVEKVIVAR